VKRCTVLGASGFIGRALVKALLASGHTVYAPGRHERPDPKTDLGHVFYCIGVTADFRQRPFDTVEAHVSLLTEFLRNYKFESFLYFSSTRIYSGARSTDENSALTVNPSDPSDLYNLSKLAGESICLSSGKNCRVVRISNVVGFDPHSDNFYAEVIRQALAGNITLRSLPQSEKDYILLDEVIEIIPKIAFHGKLPIYNVASGVNITHLEWCDALKQLTGCGISWASDSQEHRFSLIDIDRAKREFDFFPQPVLASVPQLVSNFKKSFEKSNSS
jgi:nucleoside-diphosphate-sugar epimerase